MCRSLTTGLLLGMLTIVQVGCGPRPVVVNPDADDDTTVIEERDEVDVVPVPSQPATPPESGTSVDIDVGGGRGVDVEVNRDAAPPADNPPAQNPPPQNP